MTCSLATLIKKSFKFLLSIKWSNNSQRGILKYQKGKEEWYKARLTEIRTHIKDSQKR